MVQVCLYHVSCAVSTTDPSCSYLVPVFGHLRKTGGLADVDEVEHVLLEARTPEPDRGVEELVADAGVVPQSSRHLTTPEGKNKQVLPTTTTW